MRSVRQAVNRARRAGYQVRIEPVWDLDPAQRTEAEQLSQRWRRGGERGFSMALSRFAAIEDADCLIVQARNFVGELVAVLQFVPWGKDGLSLDLVRRHPDLENGVMELMIAELLAAAPSRGVSRVSLNFAVFRSSLARGERIGAGPLLRAWVGCYWLHPGGGRLPLCTGQMPSFGRPGSLASSASGWHAISGRSSAPLWPSRGSSTGRESLDTVRTQHCAGWSC